MKALFAVLSLCILSAFSNEKIYNGSDVAFEEAPYAVFLHIVQRTKNRGVIVGEFNCGGTLITRKHVLTAAHCVDFNFDAFDVTVNIKGGSSETTSMYYIPTIGSVVGSDIKIHPQYDTTDIDVNDFAILTLKNEITETKYLKPIAFAGKDVDLSGGEVVSLIGWGKGSGQYLKKSVNMHMPKVSDSFWNDAFAEFPVEQMGRSLLLLFNQVDIDYVLERFVGRTLAESPAIEKNYSLIDRKSYICYGDSGGPVVLNDNGVPLLVGVTSLYVRYAASENECDNGLKFSGNVASVNDWILENIQ